MEPIVEQSDPAKFTSSTESASKTPFLYSKDQLSIQQSLINSLVTSLSMRDLEAAKTSITNIFEQNSDLHRQGIIEKLRQHQSPMANYLADTIARKRKEGPTHGWISWGKGLVISQTSRDIQDCHAALEECMVHQNKAELLLARNKIDELKLTANWAQDELVFIEMHQNSTSSALLPEQITKQDAQILNHLQTLTALESQITQAELNAATSQQDLDKLQIETTQTLTDLEAEISKLYEDLAKTYETLPAQFNAEEAEISQTSFSFGTRLLRRTLPGVTEQIRKETFVGWNNNERNKANLVTLDKLRRDNFNITDKQINSLSQLKETQTKNETDLKQLRSIQESFEFQQQVLEHQLQQQSSDVNQITTRLNTLIQLIQSVDSSKTFETLNIRAATLNGQFRELIEWFQQVFNTKQDNLKSDISETRKKIEAAEKNIKLKEIVKLKGYVDKAEKIAKSAEQTRQDLKTIGATPVTITTSDGARLDASFVSADNFLKSLAQVGGQRVQINLSDTQGISGFIFDQTNSEFFKTLTRLGIGNIGDQPIDTKGKAYEWLRINHKNQVIIVANTPENRELLKKQIADKHLTARPIDFTPNPGRGTVILTSGAIGVYEAHKREIMSLLSRGLNVMCFNYRGYGLSEGKPTEDSVKTDLEAVYNYLTKEQQLKSDQITVKSLCMSGAAGTHLASEHFGVNLFLDQTYSDFGNYIALETARIMERLPVIRRLPTRTFGAVSWLTGSVMRQLAPAWKVKNEISKVGGHVGILMTTDDVNTPPEEAMANMAAAIQQGGNTKVHSYIMPGEHADSWMDAKSLHITPDLFTFQRYFPDNTKNQNITQLKPLFLEYAKETDANKKQETLKKILDGTSPIVRQYIVKEKEKMALTRLHNETLELQRQPLAGTEGSQREDQWVGRNHIDDFFKKTGHLKPLLGVVA